MIYVSILFPLIITPTGIFIFGKHYKTIKSHPDKGNGFDNLEVYRLDEFMQEIVKRGLSKHMSGGQ